eukprot:2943021-Amphidinium_carterae.1
MCNRTVHEQTKQNSLTKQRLGDARGNPPTECMLGGHRNGHPFGLLWFAMLLPHQLPRGVQDPSLQDTDDTLYTETTNLEMQRLLHIVVERSRFLGLQFQCNTGITQKVHASVTRRRLAPERPAQMSMKTGRGSVENKVKSDKRR